jgi:hypothetical protein
MLCHGRPPHRHATPLSLPRCFRAPYPVPLARSHLAHACRARPTRTTCSFASAARSSLPLLAHAARPGQAKGRCWWCCSGCARAPPLVLVLLARYRIPPRRSVDSGPDLPLPYVANICFKCFRCFRGILQLFHMDVAKVDRDIAHIKVF